MTEVCSMADDPSTYDRKPDEATTCDVYCSCGGKNNSDECPTMPGCSRCTNTTLIIASDEDSAKRALSMLGLDFDSPEVFVSTNDTDVAEIAEHLQHLGNQGQPIPVVDLTDMLDSVEKINNIKRDIRN
jgi:hypothetical protein